MSTTTTKLTGKALKTHDTAWRPRDRYEYSSSEKIIDAGYFKFINGSMVPDAIGYYDELILNA